MSRTNRLARLSAGSFWIGAITICLVSNPVGGLPRGVAPSTDGERAVIEKNIRASIGWALTKDRQLLESVLACDDRLFMFQPSSKSTIVGWDQFVKQFDFWMDPRFEASRFEVRDLRIDLSRSGTVAWFAAILDDLAEWDGKPIGWKNARWTGVLEKRGGRWLIVQMHFSFAADKSAAGTGAGENSR